MGFLGLRSRSKSTSHRPDLSASSYSRPHSRSSSRTPGINDDSSRAVYLTTTSAGIPVYRESSSSASSRRGHHSRSTSSASSSSSISSGSSQGSSYLLPIAVAKHGAYYAPAPPMSAIVAPSHGHSPSMAYNIPVSAPYFGAQRQVVYPNGYDPSSSPSHLQSLHLDSHRGRPRSNTAREKILLSMAGEPVHVVAPQPLAGYSPSGPAGAPTGAPSSHESSHSYHSSSQSSTKSSGFFGFIRSRSKSKSRERDALYPGGGAAAAPEKRHRDREREAQIMQHDVETELARRMEKDLRLQDIDDPYRPVRRDRSRSFDGHPALVDPAQAQAQQQRAREREQRRNRDLDPDVQDNTRYNATSLRYDAAPSRPSRGRSDYHSGYATDAQPTMLRRTSTTAAHPHHPSSANPARYSQQPRSSRGLDVESTAPPLKGWFNIRGDELIGKEQVICQPLDRQYSSRFKHYPPVGIGFGDSQGNVIDIHGKLIKRVG